MKVKMKRIKIAWDMTLGGVGFWTGNYLDYNNLSMIHDMWSIVPNHQKIEYIH